jgi:deoxyribodipyrimidine photo-lyase
MSAPSKTTAPRTLFAFSHDLRVRDHRGLITAARYGEVVPVLVIDRETIARLRCSPRRLAYYCAAVAALDHELRALGSRLIVRRGQPVASLRSLARAIGAVAVGWSIDYDARAIRASRDLQSAFEEAGIRVLPVHDAPVMEPETLALAHPDGNGWRAFAPYFAAWRAQVPVEVSGDVRFAAHDIPSEALPAPREFGSDIELASGVSESAAAEKLARFVSGPLLTYGVARRVPSVERTAELSVELSFGVLAARRAVAAALERATDPFLLAEERASIELWLRALAQRDFFFQLGWFSDGFDDEPLQAKMRGFRFAQTHPGIDAWRAGMTGFPLVDAGMRELHATGRMHPRARSIAASFLCFDLGVDWRVGRQEWERYLIEDSPALSIANWQWAAGVGADLAYPRIYHPLKQARRYDPHGTYVRRWIPELAGLPDAVLFADLDDPTQLRLPLYGPRSYPPPIVDHEAVARAFLTRYRNEVEGERSAAKGSSGGTPSATR